MHTLLSSMVKRIVMYSGFSVPSVARLAPMEKSHPLVSCVILAYRFPPSFVLVISMLIGPHSYNTIQIVGFYVTPNLEEWVIGEKFVFYDASRETVFYLVQLYVGWLIEFTGHVSTPHCRAQHQPNRVLFLHSKDLNFL